MPLMAGKEVGPIGFGMMGLTWRDNPPSDEQAFEILRVALEKGCNCWDGGQFYGPSERNSLVLLERYLAKYPQDADRIVLNIKGGMPGQPVDASAEHIRRSLDACLDQLQGRKTMDMYEFGRRDPNIPLATSLGVLVSEYVETGKVGGVALTEVSAASIHEAVKVTKILAVEVELSLFATDVLHNGVAAACARYGIPLIAYSPIGRGILSGAFKKHADLPKDLLMMQMDFPWFRPENFEKNMALVEQVNKLAEKKGCTPAQLAINWTIAQSRRPGMPTIIAIPGCSTVERLEENSKIIDIDDQEMAEIDAILAKFTTAGNRGM
ncbi:putative aldo/keto reductase [Coniella lustricola]|uniref:Putative aldo/keto reductase n=1 Tax=Coniella lustricola TaxID=2025994 RepID=A0A2T3AB91_9PEZI|nr:putative aldo/keto reductase [Coniella lustricola]